jgi:hypothetical protein
VNKGRTRDEQEMDRRWTEDEQKMNRKINRKMNNEHMINRR